MNPAPVIGEWYRRPGGETFEVVAIDPDDRTIEIQYFDGTVEELELEERRPRTGRARSMSNPKTTRTRSRPLPAKAGPGRIRCSSSIAAKWAATPRWNCPSRPTSPSATDHGARRPRADEAHCQH
jgi:hypothetical protein